MVGLLMVGSSWDFPPWISFRMGGVHDSRCLVAQKGGGGGRERGKHPYFHYLTYLTYLGLRMDGRSTDGADLCCEACGCF